MKTVINILSAFAVLLCSLSCSYKPDIKGIDTTFDITISDLKGTQTRVTVVPGDDMSVYYFDVASSSDFEGYIRKYGDESKVMQAIVDSAYSIYQKYVKIYKEMGASYIGDFDDIALYGGTNSRYFTGLTQETDYCAYSFSIDPKSLKPAGPLYKKTFRTTDISPEPSNMALDYLLQDGGEYLYYYTKPTLDGRICLEPYLVDVVSDEELAEYKDKGGLSAYAVDWYMKKLEQGLIEYYLRSDISRNECYIIDRDSKTPKGYTVFGAPYNINNLKLKTIYSLHFVYKKGMVTEKYAHDLMQ